MTVTVSERKKIEAARLAHAAADVVEELRAYTAAHGGRFVVFGSFASGSMRHDSDLDILLDFNASKTSAAWSFVEAICARVRVEADIHDATTTQAAFVRRAMENGIELS